MRNSDGPKQIKPNKRSWEFWRRLLKTFIKHGTDLVLKQKLGKWKKDHSKHGRWSIYTYEDKVFEYRVNEMDEKKWTVYYKYGTQLCFEDELDFHKFNYKTGSLTQIKLLSNRT